ncbi:flavo protein [Anaeromyces robustus]|uniref:Flavo protein n=1 Tax=Anaeromyces robustus TaxID=1754192 RepID=A0A1Y1X0B8_9FUNG|nr:flavo protein [Anaeromyces robustus]|eukprot:ORX79142.1 flavo protein [Anaeromyces robustus]
MSTSSKDNSNCLIVFFSKHGQNFYVGNVKVGNTGRMANMIQKYLNCDIFEIVPEIPYPFTTSDTDKRARQEKNNNTKPAIKNKLEKNLNQYDTIFLGYPVWNADLPMIIYTFIEEYGQQLENKKIIPFCTHEGIDQNKPFKIIKDILTIKNCNVLRGFGLYGKYVDNSETKIINWLKELNY